MRIMIDVFKYQKMSEITKSSVLAHYNPKITLVMSVDSSKSVLGAVILHYISKKESGMSCQFISVHI